MTSAEVAKNLDSARKELQLKEKVLLEKKEAFIARVQAILPDAVDRAISTVISRNADRVEAFPAEQLRTMKKALAEEKPKAIEKGMFALRSSDWLWCPYSATVRGKDPLGWLGVNEDGPIWQSLQKYSNDLESIFKKFGFKVEEGYYGSPFRLHIPRGAGGRKDELEDLNKAVGPAGREYYDLKFKVTCLERELKETKAREKFESV